MITSSEIAVVVEQLQFADRFSASIMSPNISTVKFDFNDNIRIKSVNIPNHTIETTSVNYNGRAINVATNKTYDSIVVTFYDSEYGGLRHKFDNWMHAIFNRSKNRLGFYSDYISNNLTLNLYQSNFTYSDLAENVLGVIRFEEIFPTQIDDITYDRTSADTWVEFKVSFSFKSMIFVNKDVFASETYKSEQARIDAKIEAGESVAVDEDEMDAAMARQSAMQGW